MHYFNVEVWTYLYIYIYIYIVHQLYIYIYINNVQGYAYHTPLESPSDA